MTSFRIHIVLLVVFSWYSFHATAAEYLYLSAGDTISVKTIYQTTGHVRAYQSVPLHGAGVMAFSPDRRFLYVVANATGAKKRWAITTYAIAEDAKLRFLKHTPVKMRPSYLQTDANGRYLAGSHYREGQMSIWKLEKGVFEGESVQELTLERHAHSAIFSKDNHYILVPATSPNKVFQIQFDEQTGRVTPNIPAFARGPEHGAREPRHLVFHRELNIAYTTQEHMNPGVATWRWDHEKGRLTLMQNIVTTQEDVNAITTADVHLTPDNKFLYISNRDDKGQRDSIIGFAVDSQSGRLNLIKHFPSEHIPRSFCISKSGRYMYVAGQGDAKLGVYMIDSENGFLEKITQYQTGANPTWVTTLKR